MTHHQRSAERRRETKETRIAVSIGLDSDASAASSLKVPSGFFAHMLDALAKHGGLRLSVEAVGDTHIDLHHTVEDTGIVLGEALNEALADRAGLVRFGSAYAPLDEALARTVIDFSGRGHLSLRMPGELQQAWVTQDFPLTLIEDFLQAFAERSRATLHVDVLAGRNPHHVAEAIFKSLALALRAAVTIRPGDGSVPSTKGTLDQ